MLIYWISIIYNINPNPITLVEFLDFWNDIHQIRHAASDFRAYVCRVADDIFLSFKGQVIARHILGKAYRRGKVSGIVQQNGIQAKQLAHQA